MLYILGTKYSLKAKMLFEKLSMLVKKEKKYIKFCLNEFLFSYWEKYVNYNGINNELL